MILGTLEVQVRVRTRSGWGLGIRSLQNGFVAQSMTSAWSRQRARSFGIVVALNCHSLNVAERCQHRKGSIVLVLGSLLLKASAYSCPLHEHYNSRHGRLRPLNMVQDARSCMALLFSTCHTTGKAYSTWNSAARTTPPPHHRGEGNLPHDCGEA